MFPHQGLALTKGECLDESWTVIDVGGRVFTATTFLS
jgi:hypothetical protein